jgi:hypothetical protein
MQSQMKYVRERWRKSTDALDREWRKGETVINRKPAEGAPIGELALKVRAFGDLEAVNGAAAWPIRKARLWGWVTIEVGPAAFRAFFSVPPFNFDIV